MAQYNTKSSKFLKDGTSLYEAVMIVDQFGNITGANASDNGADTFGRARVAVPFTIFDSYHRYTDNGKTSQITNGGGSITYDAQSSLVTLAVGTAQGDYAYRETSRVFPYQPGKNLQYLRSINMSEMKQGLRQRSGFFGPLNGVFFQTENLTMSFVRRDSSTGTTIDTVVNQDDWNFDKMDGTGPSGVIIDISKSQLLFLDVEWLGVGATRLGFVVGGKFITAHVFYHANIGTGAYMATACLPGRNEIENLTTTSSPSKFHQICSSVISEGGYELRGRPYSVTTPFISYRTIPTAGTFLPVISLRLRSDRLDACAIVKSLSLLGIGNTSRLLYKVVYNPTLTGAVWTNAPADSHIQYDMSATALTGGRDMLTGLMSFSNQQSSPVDLTTGRGLFACQLERNSFTSTAHIFTIAVTGAANGDGVIAGLSWEEL